jgi:hypothetical protein
MEETLKEQGEAPAPQDKKGIKGFFSRHGDKIFLAALFIWLTLLIIGVIAEIFDIQSILDWWIWKPVGSG